jgi:hypothetical protein
MPIYRLDPNPRRISYGTSIGILQSNSRLPMAPGDIGNASTFDFPVIYRVVEEVTSERLIVQSDPTLAGPLIREARILQEHGVAAILGDCGHMLRFQEDVVQAVEIPVFLSSWLQLPFIQRILPPTKIIGVLMANSRHFRPDHLKYAGVDKNISLAVAGLQEKPAFRSAFIDEEGELDTGTVENEIVSVAKDLCSKNPQIGAILLECSDMPPYAAAIQEAIHLPVFDFVTMVQYVYSSLARTRFHGTYY